MASGITRLPGGPWKRWDLRAEQKQGEENQGEAAKPIQYLTTGEAISSEKGRDIT